MFSRGRWKLLKQLRKKSTFKRFKRQDILKIVYKKTFQTSCMLLSRKGVLIGCFLPVLWLANQETYQCHTDDVSKRCYRTTHSPVEDMKLLGWDNTVKKMPLQLLLCE